MHILPEENQLPRSHSGLQRHLPKLSQDRGHTSLPNTEEVKHVKSFLGLAGFYRPFIKGFAKIADPLSRLLTKDASFAWTAEHQQRIMHWPRSSPDAKDRRRLRPIAYASRKLNAAETRYSVTDLEALAVVWSLRHFREIILVPERTPGTLDRHIAGVQSSHSLYPGASNKVADSLSRVPTLHLDVLDREDVKSRQRQDPTYGELIGILESDPSAALPRRPHVPTSELYLEGDLLFRRSSPPKQRGTRQRHTYKQLVIPEDLVPTILRLLHEAPTASHAGADKAIKFARERYFFPRMASRITEHIRRCQVCPLHKGSASAPAPALTYDVPDRPFQRVSVDILSGFSTSTSGCRYLLVFIDAFSRFCELVPIPDKSAPTVARAFLERVICRHNTPEEFVSDNGTEFNNSVLKSLCDILNIKKVNVLPYRPQANGLTERLNRTILSMLRTSLASSGSEWDLWIPIIQMAINNTFHSTLGDTPHFVVYGEDRRLPYELLDQSPRPTYTDDYASRIIRKKQEIYCIARRHLQFERDRIIRQQHKLSRRKDIATGALVFHSASERSAPMPKLSPRFDGPYRVLQMRTLLHLLSLLHLSAASLPANYLPRPGAILEDIGTISFISSYVEITISLDVLSSFYNTASTHLSLITQYRHAISTDTSLTPPQVSSLLSFLSLSQADLTPFKDRLPRPHPRRQRRGLFNFMGDITSYLFGVATHDARRPFR
ncbi:hypothetical protein C7M84_009774 [Penaeus vannamei]|uniref:RNA-directed DNA polymerase n=1 Tax=Penaeus vannamei TaxID=6689 RepID=A0A423T5W3_PENVA|nr:hypothetical protein C7M84_009774 [Penaeus vannamei]